MKRSTGIRNHLLATGSLRSALDGKVIKIYSGTPPASADAALGPAALLATITRNSTGEGLTMDAVAVSGAITKNSNESWEGEVVTAGTASFFRMESIGDTGEHSETALRLQGTVGLSGADLNLSSVDFVVGDARKVRYFIVSIAAG